MVLIRVLLIKHTECTGLQIKYSTKAPEKACTWLGEISSCSYLAYLPGPAWVLLSKISKPIPGSLYCDKIINVTITTARAIVSAAHRIG